MDRHLLPNEIDLLLDGEVGFGTTPLKAHVRRCDACRAELEEAQALVGSLEHLPRFNPSAAFADRVMARVQIYVPWYVTVLDAARGWVPRSPAGRALAGAAALSVATALTIASLWLLTRLDTLVFAASLGLDRVQNGAWRLVSDALGGALGGPALRLLQAGGLVGLVTVGLVLLVVTAGAASLLRGFTARARRR